MRTKWIIVLSVVAVAIVFAAIAYAFKPTKKSGRMEQRVSLITIGVNDLTAEKTFYKEKLGWKPAAESKDIIFFKLNGMLFSLFDRKQLAVGAGTSPEGSGFSGVALGYAVNSKEEVTDLFNKLSSKGINILKKPEETPFGAYFFSFEDPEHNVFEVTYNPYIPLDEDGDVITHKPIDKL